MAQSLLTMLCTSASIEPWDEFQLVLTLLEDFTMARPTLNRLSSGCVSACSSDIA